MLKNDEISWIKTIYDLADERLDCDFRLKDLMIECENLCPEIDEIAALCEIVDEINNPLPRSFTASY